MKPEEYIESGILELYVLGNLPEHEKAEIARLAQENPEFNEEIAKIERAIGSFSELHNKEPRPEMRAFVYDKIFNKTSAISSDIPKKDIGWTKFLTAAVIILVLSNIITAYIFMSKYNTAKDEIIRISDENKKMSRDVEAIKFASNKLQNDIKIINDPSNILVELKGKEISPGSNALIYWNSRSKNVYLSVKDLPAPPVDKQYQLWALSGGKPIDAGVFNISQAYDLQEMKIIRDAEAFAVTLENKGGSVSPTLDKMYLFGKL